MGKRLSGRIDSMRAFAGPFRNANSGVGRTIVREIVEDSEHVFEMKITECLTEIVFMEENALDLGYACVCHADFGLPVGINPKLKLIRKKPSCRGMTVAITGMFGRSELLWSSRYLLDPLMIRSQCLLDRPGISIQGL